MKKLSNGHGKVMEKYFVKSVGTLPSFLSNSLQFSLQSDYLPLKCGHLSDTQGPIGYRDTVLQKLKAKWAPG